MSGPASISSQPANTGVGLQRSTQLVLALDALKSEKHPVSLEDFAIRHGIEQLIHDAELRDALKSNERVIHNERTDTWEWKPEYDLRTPQDLLRLVEKRYSTAYPPQKHGFRLADLRDSYPLTREAVEQFSKKRKANPEQEANFSGLGNGNAGQDDEGEEEEHKKVLIMPGPKEGSIRQVFFNEASSESYLAQNKGKTIRQVDDEFRDLWHSLPVPDSVDLPRQLAQEGHVTATVSNNDVVLAAQQAAAAAGAARARGRGRGRGRGGSSRKVRIQNTHLEGVDLSSNYKG